MKFIEMEIVVALACSLAAEADASVPTSASSYHVEENIGVVSIVVTILKFRQVQQQIFFAHLVIRAKDFALQHRPEIIQILSVHYAAPVFVCFGIDGIVRIALALQAPKFSALISRDQFYFVSIDYLADEFLGLVRADLFDHLTKPNCLCERSCR